MAEDTTGYQAALASIPKGQLSERQTRIAAGLALIREEGYSVKKAAETAGVSVSVLWRTNKGLTSTASEKGIQANEKALLGTSFDLAQMAGERLVERVQDTDNPMKDGDLVKVYGVASDKIAVRRGYARGHGAADEKTQDALAGALERLRHGDKVQITPQDPADTAIDVTPSRSSDE